MPAFFGVMLGGCFSDDLALRQQRRRPPSVAGNWWRLFNEANGRDLLGRAGLGHLPIALIAPNGLTDSISAERSRKPALRIGNSLRRPGIFDLLIEPAAAAAGLAERNLLWPLLDTAEPS